MRRNLRNRRGFFYREKNIRGALGSKSWAILEGIKVFGSMSQLFNILDNVINGKFVPPLNMPVSF
jgi:hypothetical protein